MHKISTVGNDVERQELSSVVVGCGIVITLWESVGHRLGKLRSLVQLLSHVWLFVTPWTAAPLSLTISWIWFKFMFIESMLANHLILCHLPSPFVFHLSQYQGLFQWISSSHLVAKTLELQLQHWSFQLI